MNSLLNIGLNYDQSSDDEGEEPLGEDSDRNGCVWEECFDENTKYPYYWNTKTNTVTWEMPAAYLQWLRTKVKCATLDQPIECQRTESIKSSNQKQQAALSATTGSATKRKKRIDFDVLPKTAKITNCCHDENAAKSDECGNVAKSATETETETTAKKSIIDIYSLLDDKIKFFVSGGNATDTSKSTVPKSLSSIQVMQIELNTLKTAFDSASLNEDYFANWLTQLSNHLLELEQNVAPVGWTCSWQRDEKRYVYTNTRTGVRSLNYPSDEAKLAMESTSGSGRQTVNVRDISDEMDISDPDSPADRPAVTIDDELNNFYSDIATIENE